MFYFQAINWVIRGKYYSIRGVIFKLYANSSNKINYISELYYHSYFSMNTIFVSKYKYKKIN